MNKKQVICLSFIAFACVIFLSGSFFVSRGTYGVGEALWFYMIASIIFIGSIIGLVCIKDKKTN